MPRKTLFPHDLASLYPSCVRTPIYCYYLLHVKLSVGRACLEFYKRISQRGSNMKAVIACVHKILRIIYKLLSTK